MVKRQKEKQYQSAREYKDYSQLRSGVGKSGGTVQRKLPFGCCGLTLTPFRDPVCTKSGGGGGGVSVIFDNAALMEFLLEYKKDPLTGEPLSLKDVITLHMDQDDEGRWQCPVLTKPFADHTKVVAVLCHSKKKREAYVYSYEAYKELNLKPKNWFDLTTGEKFSKNDDVLILNDPDQPQQDIQNFWHIQNGRTAQQNDKARPSTNVQHSVTATRIMEQIQAQNNKNKSKNKNNENKRAHKDDADASSNSNSNTNTNNKKLKIFADDVTGVKFTSGKAAGSFTSTAMEVASENTVREATQEEILQSQFRLMKSLKEKGYVRLITNLGDLLLELHCDIAPRTCTNFLALCERKKYNGTKFHRLIPKFMIQGGKPTDATTTSTHDHNDSNSNSNNKNKEQSHWGEPFVDEFDDRLKHSGAGVLSMANAGPNTNKQQFFITFASCPHLDRKHSVFGQVVDGMPILKNKMEKMPTDRKERPLETIKILDTDILTNPAKDAEQKEAQRMQERSAQRKSKQKSSATRKATGNINTKVATASSSMIGKYLPTSALQQRQTQQVEEDEDTAIPTLTLPQNKKSTPQPKTTFGDFSGW